MKPLLICILLLGVGPVFADDDAPKRKVAPLFTDNAVLNVTITAPFAEIMRVRSLDEEMQGTFTYRDAESGEDVTLDIGIRTRGRFRHDRNTCPFAPLRLNFKKTKGTLLAKSNKLKLVTHCRSKSGKYEQTVLREYIAYRILNTVTELSFRARLLRVRYVESTDGSEVEYRYAILLEHRDQLGKRIGMKYSDAATTTISSLDGAHTNLVSVFQFLVGNTDFSPIKGQSGEACCHNHVLLRNDQRQISVPYDFDLTGIVNAPHAKPHPRFNLSSVRQRRYRGRCVNNAQLDASFAAFRSQRPAIFELIENVEGMTNGTRKSVARYVESFYKIIDSPRLVEREILRDCLGPASPAQASQR